MNKVPRPEWPDVGGEKPSRVPLSLRSEDTIC